MEENNNNQYWKLALILSLLVSSAGYFLFLINSVKKPVETVGNKTVYFQKNTLYVFNDTYNLLNSPDRISIHGDYFLVREPLKQKTTIYSFSKGKVIKKMPFMTLDYDGKNTLYYKTGLHTYFNNTDLKNNCSTGFIQDSKHVLCVIPKEKDNLDNKVISIDPTTLAITDVLLPTATISSVSHINKTLYIGEHNLYTKQFFVTIGKTTTKTSSLPEIFYPMGNNIYFASLPNDFNNNTASYSLISQEKVKTIEKGKIVFWKGNK